MRSSQVFVLAGLLLGLANSAMADIEVIGHRGAKDIYPENSLPSIEYAIADARVDVVEVDIHMSRDGELFLNHDPTIPEDRCSFTGGSREPASRVLYDLTSEQISGFDCGSRRDALGRPKYLTPGTPLPTLQQALDVAQELDPATSFSIELKYAQNPELYPPIDVLVARVEQVLGEFDRDHLIYLQSFDPDVLKALREIYPRRENGVRLIYLYRGEEPGNGPDWEKARQFMVAEGMDVFSPGFGLMKNDVNGFLDKYSRTSRNVPVIPYTLNETFDWLMAVKLFQVDGIITDDPSALRKFLSKRR